MKKLENKVVFITGGASGIGKASAIEAAKEGAIVVIADLPNSKHEEAIKELSALAAKSLFVPIDVSDVESVKQAIQTTLAKFGRLDVAFNNAGIVSAYTDIHETDEKLWHRIINVNLTGQFYCVKYELQQFIKQGGGVMVNMASIAGLRAEPGSAPYTTSKHALLGLTKTIAVEYGSRNIRANAILPYYIETPLINIVPKDLQPVWAEATPAKRLGKADEIAKAFVYLASDDSSYCNGIQHVVDGGFMA